VNPKKKERRTKVGRDLVEAFEELAAYLRGEIEVESYEVPDNSLAPKHTKEIRRKVAS
jgi:putative transcriptional regulator